VLGQVLWVVLYVTLGYIFSGRVQSIDEILGDFAWVILGLIAAVALGWKIVQNLPSQNSVNVTQT
jgi:membrane-associated protein